MLRNAQTAPGGGGYLVDREKYPLREQQRKMLEAVQTKI
jgi:hypothetical protein